VDRCNGHGNAIAQAYNHIIMPLANRQDKITQIRWGLDDFRHRFGRDAEGMWLPETAVDMETLRLMANEGIKFTVLCPRQTVENIDTSKPYKVKGADISVFFYNAPLSQAIAFEGLLKDGASLLAHIEQTPGDMVNIATDGESYGHHEKFGDMALGWMLDNIRGRKDITCTNYGEYLAANPPTEEVRILEDTSWSCAHGIERWRSDCGCGCEVSGGSQAWREPLRDAMDWLSDRLTFIFLDVGSRSFLDPWKVRNEYMGHILNGWPTNRLLESQRMMMLAYTSCGWFFDSVTNPATIQNIRCAMKAIHLVEPWVSDNLKDGFLKRLRGLKKN
jgi:alpha-amylase/alpha-mannosidase (GH57 family)